MTLQTRLRQVCVFCKQWGQVEPNCAHGLENGVNPGSLYFAASRSLTLEIGIRAARCLTEENLVGLSAREFYFAVLGRRAA